MTSCRVYLFTYKRDQLLPRAIKSLIDQKFTNWVCEVHNDCPDSPFPAGYVKSLNDPRFIVKDHTDNLGAVASFNLAFAGCKEDYASILEDDNWWEPGFLAEMIKVMEDRPELKIAWSNMNLWQETKGNNWTSTGKTIWPITNGLNFFSWPQAQQASGALHSNGAMLYRGIYAANYKAPSNILFNAVELIRERSFEHPIALINKPLANFALTLSTNRSDDKYKWIVTQAMLLASFIATSPNPELTFVQSLKFHRAQKPSPIANFFLATLFLLRDKRFYKLFNWHDWLTISKWLIKNGYKLLYIKRYMDTQTDTYQFLLKQTQNRYHTLK